MTGVSFISFYNLQTQINITKVYITTMHNLYIIILVINQLNAQILIL